MIFFFRRAESMAADYMHGRIIRAKIRYMAWVRERTTSLPTPSSQSLQPHGIHCCRLTTSDHPCNRRTPNTIRPWRRRAFLSRRTRGATSGVAGTEISCTNFLSVKTVRPETDGRGNKKYIKSRTRPFEELKQIISLLLRYSKLGERIQLEGPCTPNMTSGAHKHIA